jgi:hypothetical protein
MRENSGRSCARLLSLRQFPVRITKETLSDYWGQYPRGSVNFEKHGALWLIILIR